MALRFATATRTSQAEFEANSPLCRSLARAAKFSAVELSVFANNRTGLPALYNSVIDAASADDTLVFVHDDVWVDDWMIAQRLREALQRFDVVGVAGNTRRVPRQEAWCLMGTARTEDVEFLSGAISHGLPGDATMHYFGAMPAQVQLLDGVLLAARAATLQRHAIRFDPAFAFHFYDTDFCRACETAGLRMGTWPIALTHASRGRYATPEWDAAYRAYLAKWRE